MMPYMHEAMRPDASVAGPGFPDPFINTLHPGVAARHDSLRWTKYHQRRSEIFAETRYLLAKMGPERLSVRRLAERCSLTTQSIYNLVGSRTEVITAAMQDHTDAILEAANHFPNSPFPVMAIDEIYLAITEQYPDFISSATRAMFGPDPELRNALYKFGWQIRETCLSRMKKDGQLVADADCAFIGQQLTLNGCTAAQEWFLGFCDLEEHWRRHRWNAATTLYRFLDPSERHRLEPVIDSYGRLASPALPSGDPAGSPGNHPIDVRQFILS